MCCKIGSMCSGMCCKIGGYVFYCWHMCCKIGGMCTTAGNREYVLCDGGYVFYYWICVLLLGVGGVYNKIGGMCSTAGNMRVCVVK